MADSHTYVVVLYSEDRIKQDASHYRTDNDGDLLLFEEDTDEPVAKFQQAAWMYIRRQD